LFAVLVQEVNQAKRLAASRFRTSKSPNKYPFNYLSIAQIGSNLIQKSANLIGFSAGEAKLRNSNAKAGTAHKSLIPSVLAFCGRSVKDKWL